jgi:glycosyltransferase involved in cell wall biosynthesis
VPANRVLIFEPYPGNKIAGNLRTLAYILKYSDKANWHFVVLAPSEMRGAIPDTLEGVDLVVLEPGSSIHRYGGRALRDSLAGRAKSAWQLLQYNLRVSRLIRERKIDVVYCNSIRALLFVGLAARLTRTPLLWYIKGDLANPLLDRMGFLIADKILFFCESNRDDKYPRLVKHYRRKIDILPIGLDPNPVLAAHSDGNCSLAAEIGLDRRRTNAIVLGQLYPNKGVHFAIEALAQVVNSYPNVMLFVVGDPMIQEYENYPKELQTLTHRLGLHDHVRFTGWRHDALKIVALMDILIHPSLAEGFGRAVLEAMALGKPVIASKVGGLRETIKDGANGFLIKPGDSTMIANRLRELIENPELRQRIGQAARDEVFSSYLVEDKVARIQAIWTEMIGNTQ